MAIYRFKETVLLEECLPCGRKMSTILIALGEFMFFDINIASIRNLWGKR